MKAVLIVVLFHLLALLGTCAGRCAVYRTCDACQAVQQCAWDFDRKCVDKSQVVTKGHCPSVSRAKDSIGTRADFALKAKKDEALVKPEDHTKYILEQFIQPALGVFENACMRNVLAFASQQREAVRNKPQTHLPFAHITKPQISRDSQCHKTAQAVLLRLVSEERARNPDHYGVTLDTLAAQMTSHSKSHVTWAYHVHLSYSENEEGDGRFPMHSMLFLQKGEKGIFLQSNVGAAEDSFHLHDWLGFTSTRVDKEFIISRANLGLAQNVSPTRFLEVLQAATSSQGKALKDLSAFALGMIPTSFVHVSWKAYALNRDECAALKDHVDTNSCDLLW